MAKAGAFWIILRTSAGQTLNLATSLTEAGYDVWTPTETVQKLRARRGNKREDVPSPLMPSFVFADADQLHRLATLARSPSLIYRVWDSELRRMVAKGHPQFSVFRSNGKHSILPDRALSPLRLAERRQKPKEEVKRYSVGEEVRLTEGGFEGLTGIVESVKGPNTFVRFPGAHWAVQIPTWVLIGAIDETPTIPVDCGRQAPTAEAA